MQTTIFNFGLSLPLVNTTTKAMYTNLGNGEIKWVQVSAEIKIPTIYLAKKEEEVPTI